jgi:hypothetical protein
MMKMDAKIARPNKRGSFDCLMLRGAGCYFLQPLAAYRGPWRSMVRGPIRVLDVDSKSISTLYAIYAGSRNFVSGFLQGLECFDAGLRLVRQWRREILESIKGPWLYWRWTGYDEEVGV